MKTGVKITILRMLLLLLFTQLSMSSCGIITINYPDNRTEAKSNDRQYHDMEESGTSQVTVSPSKEITPVILEDNQKAAEKHLASLTSYDFHGVGMVINCMVM